MQNLSPELFLARIGRLKWAWYSSGRVRIPDLIDYSVKCLHIAVIYVSSFKSTIKVLVRMFSLREHAGNLCAVKVLRSTRSLYVQSGS